MFYRMFHVIYSRNSYRLFDIVFYHTEGDILLQVIFGGQTFPLSQATKDAWPLLDRVQVSDDNDSGFKGRASVSYCKAPEDDDY